MHDNYTVLYSLPRPILVYNYKAYNSGHFVSRGPLRRLVPIVVCINNKPSKFKQKKYEAQGTLRDERFVVYATTQCMSDTQNGVKRSRPTWVGESVLRLLT